MANTIVKTPIVYYGGKTAILPHLLEMVPPHEVYTETFFGGGTLFWAKTQAKNETINDKWDIVINFYKVLKNRFPDLKKMIDQTLISRTMHLKAKNIISLHKENPISVSEVRLAWAFWMASNFGFSRKLNGGLSYSNHSGNSKPETLKNKKNEFTELLVRRIEHAYIECNDALKILKSRNVKDAFHYIDPPYFHNEDDCADHGSYKDSFTIEEYNTLLTWLSTDCKGKFLLSNYNSDMLNSFVKDNGWYKREIHHRIKAPRKSGLVKVEVLVSNYATPCGTLRLF